MTTARLTAAFALIIGGFALTAALLMPNPPHAAAAAPAAPAHPMTHADPSAAFLAQLAPSADLPAATATALTDAGQRVCEGLTAEVPVTAMESELTGELSLTPEEAHTLVAVAAVTLCVPPAV